MDIITLELPFPPSVNRLWRASRGGGVYRSPKYEQWRREALQMIAIQARQKCISGAYWISIEAVRPDKRRRDLDNILKAVSDICVTAGVIESDHLCEYLDAGWVPDGPPCLVRIFSYEAHPRKK